MTMPITTTARELNINLAVCADQKFDPELWFPHPTDDDKREAAKNVCATCPIITDCLNYGLATKADGVWGGRWMVNGRIKD